MAAGSDPVGMIGRVVPPGVVAVEAFGDVADGLLPHEEVFIATASLARRREFATTRACARAALAQLGVEPTAVARGVRGEPRWPGGIVGSMTHCDGYRAVAVARASAFAAVGVDAELCNPLPLLVLPHVACDTERQLSSLTAVAPGVCWDRLLFSAKESVFKAWWPGRRTSLGFRQIHITFGLTGTFVATLSSGLLLPDGSRITTIPGRWWIDQSFLLTGIAVHIGASAGPDAISGATRGPAACSARPQS